MSKTKLEEYSDPLKFYNHGDNPVLKNFMKIALENSRENKMIDHRTLIFDKGQRYPRTHSGFCSPGTGMISSKGISRPSTSHAHSASSSAIPWCSSHSRVSREPCFLSASSASARSLRLPSTRTSVPWESLAQWESSQLVRSRSLRSNYRVQDIQVHPP